MFPYSHHLLLLGFLVVFYYVYNAVDIVTLVASMLLGHMAIGLFLMTYPKAVESMVGEMFKKPMKCWPVWIIYVGLSLLVLKDLFM